MRTTLNLDDRILSEVIRLTQQSDRSKAVRAALAAYVQQAKKQQIIGFQHTLPLQDNWKDIRPFTLNHSPNAAQPSSGEKAQTMAQALDNTGEEILIDSLAWIAFLGKPAAETLGGAGAGKAAQVAQSVIHAIHTDRARLCGVVIAELLQAFPLSAHPKLDDIFTLIPTLPTDESMMAIAGKTVQQGRSNNKDIPLNQAIVDATATAFGALVIR